MSVEPATGAVRTMVGGPGFDDYKYNLATQNARGVGSSMKTFVLATIMEQGYSPDDIINGLAPCKFKDQYEEGGVYDVYQLRRRRRAAGTITEATLKSSNCAFVRLGLIAGAAERGRDGPPPRHPGDPPRRRRRGRGEPEVAAGASPSRSASPGITPLEMASAYATIANDGVYNPPYLIERIEDRNGKVIYQPTSRRPSSASPPRPPAWSRASSRRTCRAAPARGRELRPAGGGQDRHQPGLHRRLVRRVHAGAVDRGLGRRLGHEYQVTHRGAGHHRRPGPRPGSGGRS